ncbi:MAG: DUF1109 family protein [Pseudorhodoplanes sp.]|nr:DUF1109 family protein [Pseudorhodoplanes sp.]
MKTEQLIRALAADNAREGRPPALTIVLALLAGFSVSLAAFVLWIGPRPDLAQAVQTWPFLLKPVEMLALVGAAAVIVLRLAQPGMSADAAMRVAALAAAVMIAAAAVELVRLPQAQWMVQLSGQHWQICVMNMVLLALPMLAALLLALRHAAPTRPALAGGGAGLLAGAVSAALYIVHCPDDSPLFVAAWFGMAIAITAALGAGIGARVLRW